jgi:MT-A70
MATLDCRGCAVSACFGHIPNSHSHFHKHDRLSCNEIPTGSYGSGRTISLARRSKSVLVNPAGVTDATPRRGPMSYSTDAAQEAATPRNARNYAKQGAWGFEYKTVGFYWVKQNTRSDGYFTGLGYWTRANPEQCLLATRGKPQRRGKGVPKLVVEPRREHSRKPDVVRERIEQLVGGPYLELFAREAKQGWDCWGDQAGLFDRGNVATRRQPSRLVDETPKLPF